MIEAFERNLKKSELEKKLGAGVNPADLVDLCKGILRDAGYLVEKVPDPQITYSGRMITVPVNDGVVATKTMPYDDFSLRGIPPELVVRQLNELVMNRIVEQHTVFRYQMDYQKHEHQLKAFVPVRKLTPDEKTGNQEFFDTIQKVIK